MEHCRDTRPMGGMGFNTHELNTSVGVRLVHARLGDKTSPALVLVHGYQQRGWSTWCTTINRTELHELPNTIVVVERNGIGTAWRPPGLGSQPLEEQIQDLVAIMESLYWDGILDEHQKVSLVGHSLGALLCRQLLLLHAVINPLHLVEIAPVPDFPLFALTQPKMWVGATPELLGVLNALTSGEGMHYTGWPVRYLFTGTGCPCDLAEDYERLMANDSARLFPELVLFYGWGESEIARVRREGWAGTRHIVSCLQDTIFSLRLHERMMCQERSATVNHHCIDEAHCWWVQWQNPVSTTGTLHAVLSAAGRL